MNDDHDELTRLLAAIEEPEPPRGLRGRALAGADEAWARGPAADPWRRVWESRPLRLAWVAVVVLLAAANLAVRAAGRGRPPRGSLSAAAQGGAHNGELQAIVALPRLRPEYVALGSDGGVHATKTGTDGADARRPGTEGHS